MDDEDNKQSTKIRGKNLVHCGKTYRPQAHLTVAALLQAPGPSKNTRRGPPVIPHGWIGILANLWLPVSLASTHSACFIKIALHELLEGDKHTSI